MESFELAMPLKLVAASVNCPVLNKQYEYL